MRLIISLEFLMFRVQCRFKHSSSERRDLSCLPENIVRIASNFRCPSDNDDYNDYDYNLNCLKFKMAERTHADGDSSASAFRISRSQASRAPVSLTTPPVSDQRLRSYAVTKALPHTGAVLPLFTCK